MALQLYRPPAYRNSNRALAPRSYAPVVPVPRNRFKSGPMMRSKNRSGPYGILGSGQRHSNPVYPVPETKYIDTDAVGNAFALVIPTTAFDNAGAVVCLNAIGQGNTAITRIGATVSVVSCSYRFELSTQAASTTPTSGRVMLIWDHQPNAVAPVVALIDSILAFPNYLSFLDIANTSRFVVLRNTQFSLNPTSDQELFFEGYCKINMSSQYNPGGGTVPNTGALYLMYISDQIAGGTTPIIKGCWRVRYKDN